MDEQRWSQSSVSEAPEAITSGVRRAEDGAGAQPVPEAPPEGGSSGGYLLRGISCNPLTAIVTAILAGFALALLGRPR